MARPISYGAGVNSTALAIMLVNEGWRGDIVFANTGAEWPETYCYIAYFESEWLAPRGLAITRLGPEWRTKKRCKELSGLMEYCETYGMVPLAGVRWCTREYKVAPCETYYDGGYLLGIAADERQRQKGRLCPLIDRGISREGCIEIIQSEGLDVPQKSGCYFCPFQRNDQWRELWRRHPELIERAARLEEIATARVRSQGKHWGVTLDPSGKVSLRDRIDAFERQIELIQHSAGRLQTALLLPKSSEVRLAFMKREIEVCQELLTDLLKELEEADAATKKEQTL